jgi:ArsR family transcriptional regulator
VLTGDLPHHQRVHDLHDDSFQGDPAPPNRFEVHRSISSTFFKGFLRSFSKYVPGARRLAPMSTTASATRTASPTATRAAGPTTALPVIAACCTPAAGVSETAAAELATMFKALADPARVTIVSMLLNADEVCACDVSDGIGKTAATASHHLKILRQAGLVATEKRGTWVYYRVVPERLAALRDALTFGG